MKLVPDLLLPSLRQVTGDVGILGEEAVFMRDSLVIEHRTDHV